MKHLKNFEGLFDMFKSKKQRTREEMFKTNNFQKEVNSKIKLEKEEGLTFRDTYKVIIVKNNKDCFQIGEIRKQGNTWGNYIFVNRTSQRNKNMDKFISPDVDQLKIIEDELASNYNPTINNYKFLEDKFGIILK